MGRLREAADELRQLATEHPLRDQPSLLLMRALHRLGASADALAVYAVHRQALADELGLDPSPELDEAQRDILERTPDPSPSNGKTPATTGETTTRPTFTVPDLEPTKRLIGRHDDIEQVRVLTARHQCVTVVGPGGVGKTSLARAVAAAEQVAWWADLTSVSTQAGVRAVVATALGVEVFPGGSAEAALHRRLETATGLLVLDNCEHVLATVGDLTTGIAAFGAGVRVLATSRERLGLQVEQVYPLAPLRLPGAGAAADADVPSVALFLERARRIGPRPRGHAGRRRATSPSSSAGSTASPSPSSSPRAAWASSAWQRCATGSMTGWTCCGPTTGADLLGTRPWSTRSTGPTTSSTKTTGGRCDGSRCSPAPSTWTRPRPCSGRTRPSRCSVWSSGHCSYGPRRAKAGTACSRPSVRTRGRCWTTVSDTR